MSVRVLWSKRRTTIDYWRCRAHVSSLADQNCCDTTIPRPISDTLQRLRSVPLLGIGRVLHRIEEDAWSFAIRTGSFPGRREVWNFTTIRCFQTLRLKKIHPWNPKEPTELTVHKLPVFYVIRTKSYYALSSTNEKFRGERGRSANEPAQRSHFLQSDKWSIAVTRSKGWRTTAVRQETYELGGAKDHSLSSIVAAGGCLGRHSSEAAWGSEGTASCYHAGHDSFPFPSSPPCCLLRVRSGSRELRNCECCTSRSGRKEGMGERTRLLAGSVSRHREYERDIGPNPQLVQFIGCRYISKAKREAASQKFHRHR